MSAAPVKISRLALAYPLLRRVIPVEQKETAAACLFFAYFFCTITAYYLLKPVRDASFLHELGAGALPKYYILTAVVNFALSVVYSWLRGKVRTFPFILGVLSFTVVSLLSFRVFFSFSPTTAAGWLFLWASSVNVLLVSLFWSFANDFFAEDQGKRLYGFIGAGGVSGGILGGLMAGWLAPRIGSYNLLLVSSAFIACAGVCAALIYRREWDHAKPTSVAAPVGSGLFYDRLLPGLQLVLGSRYTLLLAGLVACLGMSATLWDIIFKSAVERALPGNDDLTHFFGYYGAALSAGSLAIQFFVTHRSMRLIGIFGSLAILPLLYLVGSPIMTSTLDLFLLTAFAGATSSISYSLHQATKEVLYIRLPLAVKYKAKAFIELFFFRLGDLGGATFAFIIQHYWANRYYGAVCVGVAAVWLAIVVLLRREYDGLHRGSHTKDVNV